MMEGKTETKNKSQYDDDILIIKSTLEKIRPFLQREGGDVEFISYDQEAGIVKLKVVGTCNGCVFASDEITQGVTMILEQELPTITQVIIDQDEDLSYKGYSFAPGILDRFPDGIPIIDPINEDEEEDEDDDDEFVIDDEDDDDDEFVINEIERKRKELNKKK